MNTMNTMNIMNTMNTTRASKEPKESKESKATKTIKTIKAPRQQRVPPSTHIQDTKDTKNTKGIKRPRNTSLYSGSAHCSHCSHSSSQPSSQPSSQTSKTTTLQSNSSSTPQSLSIPPSTCLLESRSLPSATSKSVSLFPSQTYFRPGCFPMTVQAPWLASELVASIKEGRNVPLKQLLETSIPSTWRLGLSRSPYVPLLHAIPYVTTRHSTIFLLPTSILVDDIAIPLLLKRRNYHPREEIGDIRLPELIEQTQLQQLSLTSIHPIHQPSITSVIVNREITEVVFASLLSELFTTGQTPHTTVLVDAFRIAKAIEIVYENLLPNSMFRRCLLPQQESWLERYILQAYQPGLESNPISSSSLSGLSCFSKESKDSKGSKESKKSKESKGSKESKNGRPEQKRQHTQPIPCLLQSRLPSRVSSTIASASHQQNASNTNNPSTTTNTNVKRKHNLCFDMRSLSKMITIFQQKQDRIECINQTLIQILAGLSSVQSAYEMVFYDLVDQNVILISLEDDSASKKTSIFPFRNQDIRHWASWRYCLHSVSIQISIPRPMFLIKMIDPEYAVCNRIPTSQGPSIRIASELIQNWQYLSSNSSSSSANPPTRPPAMGIAGGNETRQFGYDVHTIMCFLLDQARKADLQDHETIVGQFMTQFHDSYFSHYFHPLETYTVPTVGGARTGGADKKSNRPISVEQVLPYTPYEILTSKYLQAYQQPLAHEDNQSLCIHLYPIV